MVPFRFSDYSEQYKSTTHLITQLSLSAGHFLPLRFQTVTISVNSLTQSLALEQALTAYTIHRVLIYVTLCSFGQCFVPGRAVLFHHMKYSYPFSARWVPEGPILGPPCSAVNIPSERRLRKCNQNQHMHISEWKYLMHTLYRYMFRPITWGPRSGRRIAKDRYVEMLQKGLNQCSDVKILGFKKIIDGFKIHNKV